MSDELRVYEQTLTVAQNNRAQAIKQTRYSPWRMGLYVTGSLALDLAPLAAGIGGYQYDGWWMWGLFGLLGSVLLLPFPVLVIVWVVDATLVERERLRTEKSDLRPLMVSNVGNAPALEAPGGLRPGILVNGSVMAPLATLSTDKARLKSACLLLVRAGAERGSWTRAAIAEGVDAMMPGELWDLASPELQRLGYFWSKPGKGGGLRPSDKMYTVAQIIERLEVAQ